MKEGAASQTVPVDRPVLLAGSTGTIGRAVAQCLVDDGYDLVRLVRRAQTGQSAALGREVVQDIADAGALQRQFEAIRPKAVISCIASASFSARETGL